MPRIGLLGATGKVGSMLLKNFFNACIQQSIDCNMKVFVRNLTNLQRMLDINTQDFLTIFEGDLYSNEKLHVFLQDLDILISCLGHRKTTPRFFQRDIFQRITNYYSTTKKHCLLISLTGSGVFIEGDKPSFIDKLLQNFIKFIDKKRFEDGQAHVKVIQESSLDYIVVRTPVHTNLFSKRTLHINNFLDGKAFLAVNRQQIVNFITDLVISDKKRSNYINSCPVVGSIVI